MLFAGTLVFGVNLLDSFLQGLTAKQANRLIWAPDMVGCTLFLVSGHLGAGADLPPTRLLEAAPARLVDRRA